MTWQELSVISKANTVTAISDLFSELSAVSVTYMDAEDQPLYEPNPGETKVWKNTRIIGLFESNADLDLVQALISTQLADFHLENWQQRILRDQVWERAWMDYYQPMLFADRLWVCPTGQERTEAGSVCMTLDPGLAFGTGTHPTTALCLEWLAQQDLSNKTIIDYGCGSGILAIASILLNAKQAYAIDIDPQALTATRENAAKNHVREQVKCYLPDQIHDLKADIVLANILAKPLIELAPQISQLLADEGQLVLSGILSEQAETVIQAYLPFLTLNPPLSRQEWCLLGGCMD